MLAPNETSGVSLQRGWIAVALVPVFFLLAFAFGYLVYDLLGYQPENDDAPLWVDLIGTVLLPLGLGALVGLGLTILSIVTLVAG